MFLSVSYHFLCVHCQFFHLFPADFSTFSLQPFLFHHFLKFFVISSVFFSQFFILFIFTQDFFFSRVPRLFLCFSLFLQCFFHHFSIFLYLLKCFSFMRFSQFFVISSMFFSSFFHYSSTGFSKFSFPLFSVFCEWLFFSLFLFRVSCQLFYLLYNLFFHITWWKMFIFSSLHTFIHFNFHARLLKEECKYLRNSFSWFFFKFVLRSLSSVEIRYVLIQILILSCMLRFLIYSFFPLGNDHALSLSLSLSLPRSWFVWKKNYWQIVKIKLICSLNFCSYIHSVITFFLPVCYEEIFHTWMLLTLKTQDYSKMDARIPEILFSWASPDIHLWMYLILSLSYFCNLFKINDQFV